MPHRVVFSPEAKVDLLELYDFIAEHGEPVRALAYVERIQSCCMGLADFPVRGSRRDEVRPGLRTFGFERRATIAFHIAEDRVIIDRILYGGRDLSGAFVRDDEP